MPLSARARDVGTAVGLLAAAMLHGHGAIAQDALCTANLGDVRVRGNLNITSRCQLTETDVRGNVILFAGGSLLARGARIRGNLEGSRADFVDLDRVRVDGNVDLQELVGDSSRIERSDVRANVVLASNRSRFEILNNELKGNLRAMGNRGGLLISGNSIDGNLECAGNSPAPMGIGNRIDGDAEGQCANLRPERASTPPPAAPPAATPPTPTRPPAASPPSAAPPQPTTPGPSVEPPQPPPSTPAPTTRPPAAAPPTPAPPATTTPPAATPPAGIPPAATPATPASSPPAPTTTPAAEISLDDGGAGAIGWPIALLLPLVAWRRLRRRRWDQYR